MLTKDSFHFTHIFLYYQILENKENYLYTRFSIETNGALLSTKKPIQSRLKLLKRKKKKQIDGFLQKSVQQVLILGHWKKLIRPPHFKTMFCRWQLKFES